MEDMEDFFVYAILIERSGRRSITYSNKQKNDISQGKALRYVVFLYMFSGYLYET